MGSEMCIRDRGEILLIIVTWPCDFCSPSENCVVGAACIYRLTRLLRLPVVALPVASNISVTFPAIASRAAANLRRDTPNASSVPFSSDSVARIWRRLISRSRSLMMECQSLTTSNPWKVACIRATGGSRGLMSCKISRRGKILSVLNRVS